MYYRFRNFLLSAAALGVTSGAAAADYYVDPNGSGANSGTSCSDAGSVYDAFQTAGAGDQIIFCDGVYGAVKIAQSGVPGNPLVVRAAAGAVPIIRGTGADGAEVDGIYSDGAVSNVIIDGFWIENWYSAGISLDYRACSESTSHAVSSITIVNCVVDSNLRSGISAFMGSGYTIENNIVSRNGNGPESWSSNVNLYGVTGSNNVVRGNIAFHGVDTSGNNTDGNGFILDLTLDSGGATFEDNIGFLNGGACIAVTDSGGAQIRYNSCYHNGQTTVDEFSFIDTCRGQVACINVANQGWTFNGYSFQNNLAVADGSKGNNGTNSNSCGSGASFSGSGNQIGTTGGQFADPTIADFTTSDASGSRLVYDPRCIKQESGALGWWTFAPDLEFIQSIGGIRNCFDPGTITCGEQQTLCTDGCRDLQTDAQNCGGCGTQCSAGERCEVGTCQSGPVEPTIDESSGYVESCNWAGYTWTAAGPEEPGVNGTLSSIEKTSAMCASGTVAAYENYGGYAMLGWNIAQVSGVDTAAAEISPEGDGLSVSVSNQTTTQLRIQIQDAQTDNVDHRWCVEVEGEGGYYPWSSFNTTCWDGAGIPYMGEPVNVIAVTVAGSNEDDVAFDFCLEGASPTGVTCTGFEDGSVMTGTGGTDAGTGGSTMGSSCQVPLAECNATCVDIGSDPNNCGACASVCGASSVCSLGVCAEECQAGLTQCERACVDTVTNLLHCGACGAACLTGQSCQGSVCVGEATGDPITQPGETPPGGDSDETSAAPGCGCRSVGRHGSTRGGALALALGLSWVALRRRRRTA